MMRLPRLIPSIAIACILSAPVLPAPAAWGQRPAGAAAQPDRQLEKAASDFFHYATIANYDAAKAIGERILGMNAPPMDVFQAFEAAVAERNRRVPPDRRIDLYERMLAWQRIPELRDIVARLLATFNEAKKSRSEDPQFIRQNIERLTVNRRAYELAMQQLRASGELAVPIMITYLQDPARQELHVAVSNALRDLGQKALNPLVAASEMKDWNTLPWIINALGDLGYNDAVPYLTRILQDRETPETIRTAATQALMRLGARDAQDLDAADLFYGLAERLYYEKSSIIGSRTPVADPAQAISYIWYWNNGLVREEVPSAIFNEHMTLRACETILRINPERSDAVSLWLAAAFKREVELPEGGADPIWTEEHPATHYFAVTSGTRHLNPVLDRALRDRDNALALKAIKSLQEIVGATNLFSGSDATSIADALRYPDRRVRFEAAFTVAAALPEQAFPGQDRVVPILAEAIAQTGKGGVVVLTSSQDELNRLRELLEKRFALAGGTNVDAAISAAASLPSVDVVIVRETDPGIDRLFARMRDSVRLERASILVLVTSEVASPYATIALGNPQVTVTAAMDEAGLLDAIETARTRAGGLPIDEELATSYALRATDLLERLAISRGQVLDLAAAQSTLLAALNDPRVEIARASGEVLALFDSPEAQIGLANHALADNTPDDLRLSFLKNLSTSAKFYRNRLSTTLVDRLTQYVETARTPELRAAAAEAHGALNLPPDQVKTLILNQAR